MSLRKRIAILLVLGAVALTAGLYLATRTIVLERFEVLEERQARRNMERATEALAARAEALDENVVDWAWWDDTWAFMAGEDEERYTEANLLEGTFREQGLAAVAFLRPDGGLYWGMQHVREDLLPLDSELLEALARLTAAALDAEYARGLLLLRERTLLVAAKPILTSDRQGPPRGVLIMARPANEAFWASLGARTRLDVSVMRCSVLGAPQRTCAMLAAPGAPKADILRSGDSLTITGLVRDVFGAPALLLSVDMDRDLYAEGRRTVRSNLAALLAGGMLFCGLVLLLLERRVFARLAELVRQLRRVGGMDGEVKRIRLSGADELADLAASVNAMLDELWDNDLFMRQVLDAVEVGVLLVDPETREIEDVNGAALRMVGLTKADVVGRVCHGFLCPSVRGSCPILDQSRPGDRSVGTLLGTEGREVPVLKSVRRVARMGRPLLLESFIDISELLQAQQALAENESTYRAIFDHTGTASMLIDEDTTVLLVNAEFERLSERPRMDVEGRESWKRFFASQEHERMLAYHRLRRSTPGDAPRTYEAVFVTASGEERQVEMTVGMLPDGKRSIASVLDVTEKKRAEAQLVHRALHDDLTGLPNRQLLLDRLSHDIQSADRAGAHVGVLLVDLDHFKNLNDTFGHSFGDQVLQAAARILTGVLRKKDTVAHLGGDSFVVVVDDAEGERALVQVAETILGAFGEPVAVEGRTIYPGVSVGLAIHPLDGDTAEDLVKHAELAMFRAKELGRGTFSLFTEELNAKVHRRINVENELRAALDAGALEVHFQPIVDAATGAVAAAEALVRWPRAAGLTMPGSFIPVAEASGLITRLDAWVLARACGLMVGWEARFGQPLRVNVNLSAAHFRQPGLAGTVRRILEETGCPAKLLCLEITESAIMEHISRAADELAVLREMGVQVALDDFGKGYSSLNYLNRLPISCLKVDRAFVAGIAGAGDADSLVRTILDLGRSLDLIVVAEGVETREQYEFLLAHGCDRLQGHLLARAEPVDAFEVLLADGVVGPADVGP